METDHALFLPYLRSGPFAHIARSQGRSASSAVISEQLVMGDGEVKSSAAAAAPIDAETAAIKIQAIARGWKAKKDIWVLQRAAMRMQAIYRGHKARGRRDTASGSTPTAPTYTGLAQVDMKAVKLAVDGADSDDEKYKDSAFTAVNVLVGTWNVGHAKVESDLGRWLPARAVRPDIVVVGLQECRYRVESEDEEEDEDDIDDNGSLYESDEDPEVPPTALAHLPFDPLGTPGSTRKSTEGPRSPFLHSTPSGMTRAGSSLDRLTSLRLGAAALRRRESMSSGDSPSGKSKPGRSMRIKARLGNSPARTDKSFRIARLRARSNTMESATSTVSVGSTGSGGSGSAGSAGSVGDDEAVTLTDISRIDLVQAGAVGDDGEVEERVVATPTNDGSEGAASPAAPTAVTPEKTPKKSPTKRFLKSLGSFKLGSPKSSDSPGTSRSRKGRMLRKMSSLMSAEGPGTESACASTPRSMVSTYTVDEAKLKREAARKAGQHALSAIATHLGDGYKLVHSVTMWELTLAVWVKEEHIEDCLNTEDATKAVQWMGMTNKGGVALKFDFYETSLCFINMHLPAHDANHYVAARNVKAKEIMEQLAMGKPDVDITNQFDHLFILGDLNYRLDMSIGDGVDRPDKAAHIAEIHRLVRAKKWLNLYMVDQLRREMALGHVMKGFQEGIPFFPPPFSHEREIGLRFEADVRPAYPGRVLWRSLPASRRLVKQLWLRSAPDVDTSNHKPVSSLFQLTVPPPAIPYAPTMDGPVICIPYIECDELLAMDDNGKSDPYIRMQSFPEGMIKNTVSQTQTRLSTLTPSWKNVKRPIKIDCHPFPIKDLKRFTLTFHIQDWDLEDEDDHMGCAHIPMADIVGSTPETPMEFELGVQYCGFDGGILRAVVYMVMPDHPDYPLYNRKARNRHANSATEASSRECSLDGALPDCVIQ